MGTWFATREDVRSALDVEDAARSDARLDSALDAASAAVVGLCNRDFVPTLATKVFDWPSEQTPRSWRVWLDQHDLISPTLITSAGVTVPPSDYYLEPANSGPPYTHVETRLDQPSAWASTGTYQHAVTITGWWGYTDNQAPAGALVGGIDAATTAVAVTDSSLIGVGHILTVGDERMTVTAKRLTSSGQVLQAPLDAKASSQQVTVQDGAAFTVGEVITLDAERMEIRDIADNTLIVKRAVQGTVLGAHTGSTVYAPRLLTVTRGDYGTTPASATDGTALTRWVPPALVHQLAVAESLNWLLNEQSGYLRTTGGTSGSGGKEPELIALKDLRDQCYTEHGRKTRTRAV